MDDFSLFIFVLSSFSLWLLAAYSSPSVPHINDICSALPLKCAHRHLVKVHVCPGHQISDFNSKAHTCSGHPVLPLLFFSSSLPTNEYEDADPDRGSITCTQKIMYSIDSYKGSVAGICPNK